jgi:dTDP-4-amino-4,6-dideoxygalactose transaminase
LAELPGISFPQVPEGSRSTFKDFTILVDPDAFGLDAAHLAQALAAEGVETRRYYAPPVHTMRAYRYLNGRNGHLPVTEQISARVLTLPLWSDMTESHLLRVAEAIGGIHRAARLENFPPVAGEKIPRLQDGPAGLRAYGNGGSEGGRHA